MTSIELMYHSGNNVSAKSNVCYHKFCITMKIHTFLWFNFLSIKIHFLRIISFFETTVSLNMRKILFGQPWSVSDSLDPGKGPSFLKTRDNTPKYGLIFHSAFIGQAAIKSKGHVSQYLGDKYCITL